MTTEKDHQIIVSELRPMSEAKGDITKTQILIYFSNDNPSVDDVYVESSGFNHTNNKWSYTKFKGYSIIGWIPIPTYKPETVDIYMPEFDGPIPTDDQV